MDEVIGVDDAEQMLHNFFITRQMSEFTFDLGNVHERFPEFRTEQTKPVFDQAAVRLKMSIDTEVIEPTRLKVSLLQLGHNPRGSRYVG